MKIQSGRVVRCLLFTVLLAVILPVSASASVLTAGTAVSGKEGVSVTKTFAEDAAQPESLYNEPDLYPESALTADSAQLSKTGSSSASSSETKASKDSDLTWRETANGLRIQASDGRYRKGFVRYKGKLYYFDSKGYLVTGFFKAKGKVYYASCARGYKGRGEILTGLWKIGRDYYYLDPLSKPYEGVVSSGFRRAKGRTYYFDKHGRMVHGWFKVSGNTYYASCNKYSGYYGQILKGVQKIGMTIYRLDEFSGKLLGRAYTNSSKYMHMVDLSEFNGNVDFHAVRNSGVRAVILRAGYGDSTVDNCFHQNISRAKEAGLAVGIYWFSYALNKHQAVTEANYCLRTIKKYNLNLPVYFDWEYDSMRYAMEHGVRPGRKAITEMTEAFCSTIARSGRRAGYYFNPEYLHNYYDASKLKRYSTWYAFWGNNLFTGNIWIKSDMLAPPKQYDLWQFSACGRIPGISTPVDCDLMVNKSILR